MRFCPILVSLPGIGVFAGDNDDVSIIGLRHRDPFAVLPRQEAFRAHVMIYQNAAETQPRSLANAKLSPRDAPHLAPQSDFAASRNVRRDRHIEPTRGDREHEA